MATKNLARTIIEGGRSGFARYLLRLGTKRDRRKAARYCKSVCLAVEDEGMERGLPDPRRFLDYDAYSHADCLSPMCNWVKARIGSRWDDVYSELSRTYDRRKLRNQHLIDHVISFVSWRRNRLGYWRNYGEHIDEDGFLVAGERYIRR